jgi:hypothetical protein
MTLVMNATLLAILMAQQTPTPPPNRPPELLRGRDLVDRRTPEQKLFEVPRWDGTFEQIKAAEQGCREAHGESAVVKIQDEYASCCRSADLPFGLCDSLTFK